MQLYHIYIYAYGCQMRIYIGLEIDGLASPYANYFGVNVNYFCQLICIFLVAANQFRPDCKSLLLMDLQTFFRSSPLLEKFYAMRS